MGIVSLEGGPLEDARPDHAAHLARRHTAAPPTAFGTVMVYVALRLLGTDKDLPEMIEIRALIHKIGK
jgi:hypothetical protein